MNTKYPKKGVGPLVLLAIFGGLAISETAADERPTDPELGSNTFELLSYQDSGYGFKIIGLEEDPPLGFEQPDFDETGFDIGNAAFGSGGEETVQTPWPVNSELLVRRVVSIPAGTANVRIMVSVDNDILGVFFNGTKISDLVEHDGSPIRDEFRFDVPRSLVQEGENLIAFHVLDRGEASFFDTRILAELSLAELNNAMASTVLETQEGIPEVPISDIKFDCFENLEERRATITFLLSETMEAGEVEISSAHADETTTLQYSFDGKLLLSGSTSPQGPQAQILEKREMQREILALESVFADQKVRSGLLACYLVPRNLGNSTTASGVSAEQSGGDGFRECERDCNSNANSYCERSARQQSLIGGIIGAVGIEVGVAGLFATGVAIPIIGAGLAVAGFGYAIYQEFVAEPTCSEKSAQPCAESCDFIHSISP